MPKIKLLLFIFLLSLKTVTAQSLLVPVDGLQISFATGSWQYKDYLLNGLRNNGFNLSFGVDYGFHQRSLNHEIGFHFDAAALWNRYKWDTYCFQPAFHYRLLANVKDVIQLGGNVNYACLNYRDENLDSHHNYWRTCISLGFSACYHYNINEKWTLFVPLNLPLVGLLSRPPADRHLILNEPDIKLSDVLKRMHSDFQYVIIGDRYFEIETGISFGVTFQQGNKLIFGYKLLYEQTSISLKSQLFTNEISLQYAFKKNK
jgi:hypothetical protein